MSRRSIDEISAFYKTILAKPRQTEKHRRERDARYRLEKRLEKEAAVRNQYFRCRPKLKTRQDRPECYLASIRSEGLSRHEMYEWNRQAREKFRKRLGKRIRDKMVKARRAARAKAAKQAA